MVVDVKEKSCFGLKVPILLLVIIGWVTGWGKVGVIDGEGGMGKAGELVCDVIGDIMEFMGVVAGVRGSGIGKVRDYVRGVMYYR